MRAAVRIIGVTLDDAAGIGPEIIAAVLHSDRLDERSEVSPKMVPARTAQEVEELVVAERRKHPTLGAEED